MAKLLYPVDVQKNRDGFYALAAIVISVFLGGLMLWSPSSLYAQNDPFAGKRNASYAIVHSDTLISLSDSTISEQAADSSIVGTVVIPGKVSADSVFLIRDADSRFMLYNNRLAVGRSELLDFEQKRKHRIVIAVQRSDGKILKRPFVITVTNVNEPPKAIELSRQRLKEHTRGGEVVGRITVLKEESADSISLTLVEDARGRFQLRDDSLLTSQKARFDHEEQAYLDIQVRAADQQGMSLVDTLRIKIIDQNDPPEAVRLHPSIITENEAPGTLIGKLSTLDEDSADIHAYQMGSIHPDALILRDSILYLSDEAALNYEERPIIRFSVQSTDTAGAVIVDTLKINVKNVNEPPSVKIPGKVIFKEDQYEFAFLQVRDPETPAGALEVQFYSDNPDLLPKDRIQHINRGPRRKLMVRPLPDSSGQTNIRVTVNDGEYVDSASFKVEVDPVNDSPYLIRNIKGRLDEGARLLIAPRLLRVRDVDNNFSELTFTVIEQPSHGKLLMEEEGLEDRKFTQKDVNRGRIWYKHSGSEYHRDTLAFAIKDNKGGRLAPVVLPLHIVPRNDPPRISELNDRYILEDRQTGTIYFEISDPETPAVDLRVSGSSSNPKLVPDSSIKLSGLDRIRSVRINPLPDANGQSNITITVGDGVDKVRTRFTLNVEPVNDAPVIRMPKKIKMKEDRTKGPVSVRLFDQEKPTSALKFHIQSTNERLLNRDGIQIKGEGPHQYLYLTPQKNHYGKARIIVHLNDGVLADTAKTTVRVKSVNDAPSLFSLFNSNLKQSLDSVKVTFNWEEALDVDNRKVEYLLKVKGTKFDTTIKEIHDTQFTFGAQGNLEPNAEYEWLVYATDGRDTTRSKAVKQFLTPNIKQSPEEFKLYSNYPNPFNPITRIRYKIPVRSRVKVAVYDMSGRRITQLVNEVQSPGKYEVTWNAGDRASGIYVCRIMANGLHGDRRFTETRKMMLVK